MQSLPPAMGLPTSASNPCAALSYIIVYSLYSEYGVEDYLMQNRQSFAALSSLAEGMRRFQRLCAFPWRWDWMVRRWLLWFCTQQNDFGKLAIYSMKHTSDYLCLLTFPIKVASTWLCVADALSLAFMYVYLTFEWPVPDTSGKCHRTQRSSVHHRNNAKTYSNGRTWNQPDPMTTSCCCSSIWDKTRLAR